MPAPAPKATENTHLLSASPGVAETSRSVQSHSTEAVSSSRQPERQSQEFLRADSRPSFAPSGSRHSLSRAGSVSTTTRGSQRSQKSRASSVKAFPRSFRQLAEYPGFERLTLAIICLNALWIGADVEWNNAALRKAGEDAYPLEPYSIIVENFFCLYFTMEVGVRFVAFERKKESLRDAWFVFDTSLVAVMILEVWILPLLELFIKGSGSAGSLSSLSVLRILRLTRMVRISRSIKGLRILVKSMVSGLKATFFILIFLVLMMWLFAIIFTAQLSCAPPFEMEDDGMCPPNYDFDDGAGNRGHIFGSLGSSMMTLWTNGVLGDNLYQTLDITKGEGKLSDLVMYWLFIIFYMLTALTLLNMLIGVLVENIQNTEVHESSSMWEADFKECMKNSFDTLDTDKSGRVSIQEWEHIRSDEEVRRTLAEDLKCEEEYIDRMMDKMEDVLFCRDNGSTARRSVYKEEEASGGINFQDFVENMLELRPGKMATPLDLSLVQSYLVHNKRHLERGLTRIQARLEDILGVTKSSTSSCARSEAHSARSSKSSTKNQSQESVKRTSSVDVQPISEVSTIPLESPLQCSASASQAALMDDVAFIPEWLQEVPTEILFNVLQRRAASLDVSMGLGLVGQSPEPD